MSEHPQAQFVVSFSVTERCSAADVWTPRAEAGQDCRALHKLACFQEFWDTVPALVNFTCGLETSPSYESCFSSAED